MEGYHAYLEKIRLEQLEKDRLTRERLAEEKEHKLASQLKACDIHDLSIGIHKSIDLRQHLVYKQLVVLLNEHFQEDVDYRRQKGRYDQKIRYKLHTGVGIRLTGLYLAWARPKMQSVGYKTIMRIKRAYADEISEREFKVRTDCHEYRVDLYLPVHKIAIECDEEGHRYRDKNYERTRQDAITAKTGCTFIRYNPDAKDFDIEAVIRELGVMIKEAKARPESSADSDEYDSDDGSESCTSEESKPIDPNRITGIMDPGWLDMMPSRRHYNRRLWYLTPYGEQEWPYEVPYGIYPPFGYVKPDPVLPRPPGAGVASPELIRREAIAANAYGRGPWPGLPENSRIKAWYIAECNLPGSIKPVILGNITNRLIKLHD